MGRLKSIIWKHFQKVDNQHAICMYCDKTLKTSGNTSNMKGHLSAAHASILGYSTDTTDTEDDEGNIPKKRSHVQGSSNSNSKKLKVEAGSSALTSQHSKPIASNVQGLNSTAGSAGRSSTCSTSGGSSTSSRHHDLGVSSSSTVALKSKIKENIKDVFVSMKSFQEGGAKHTKLTDTILFMICKDSQPLATVKREGFRELIAHVAPNYKLPCRKTFARRLDQKYNKLLSDYKDILRTVKDITLTTDLWTDTLNTPSFLGVTAHFRQGSEIMSIILGVYEFTTSHTAAHLKEKLRSVCEGWGITTDNISAIVTDNAANIVKAVEEFVGKKYHLGCCAHKINLVVEKSIKGVTGLPDLIQKVKSIVTWFKQSNKASDELRAAFELKLKQDVDTRWNSTFYMLERFIKIRRVVHDILYNYPSAPPMVTPQELEELIEVCNVLKPLEEITREWSAEKHVTLSKIIPMIHGLVDHLQTMNANHGMAEELKRIMLGEIKQRFDQVEKVPMFAISTLLDPIFKKIDFKDPVACSRTINLVKNMLLRQHPQNSNDRISETEEIISNNNPGTSLWKRHMELAKQAEQRKNALPSLDELPDELSVFLKTPIAALDENPIKLWIDMASAYPDLSQIPFKYLTIMATSVPSERLFSKAGENMTARRNRLSGQRLHKQLFLSSLEKTLCRTNGTHRRQANTHKKAQNTYLSQVQRSEITSSISRFEEP